MFTSMTDFSLHIEKIVKDTGKSYLETLMDYANETGAEFDAMAKMMTETLKEKIRLEASEEYMLPKSTTTVLDV